jgi:hypothetical protein
VAVGEAKASLWQTIAQGAQDAGLTGTGLAREDHGGVLVDGFLKLVHDGLLRRWQPEIGVGDLLREGNVVEAEMGEVGRGHEGSWVEGVRPTALSSRTVGGSNATG